MLDQPGQSRDAVNSIFGDALSPKSPEDRDDSSPDDDSKHDRWLQENTPPHHH